MFGRLLITILSALFYLVCSFVTFAFKRINNLVGKAKFRVEQMRCLYWMLRYSFLI